MLGAHHGGPMAWAVLLSLNTRLDADIIAFQLVTQIRDARIIMEQNNL